MPRIESSCAAFCLAAWLVLLSAAGSAQERAAQRPASAGSDADGGVLMQFQIPSQALQQALDTFIGVTGFSGLYDADNIGGRTSGAVQGSFSALAALRMMLAPSGLSAYFTAPDAFVLEAATPATTTTTDNNAYQARLQASVRSAFCRHPLLATGDYRIAFSFQVSPGGRAEQVRLLDSSGNRVRDEAIVATLRTMQLAAAPANPGVPFVMLILPRTGATNDCEAAP